MTYFQRRRPLCYCYGIRGLILLALFQNVMVQPSEAMSKKVDRKEVSYLKPSYSFGPWWYISISIFWSKCGKSLTERSMPWNLLISFHATRMLNREEWFRHLLANPVRRSASISKDVGGFYWWEIYHREHDRRLLYLTKHSSKSHQIVRLL
jgi:hypothetical protein